MPAATDAHERYTITSADCHADGSHAAHRDHLDALAPPAAEIGPTVSEIATPLDEVPRKQVEPLSGDMDPKVIK